MAMLTTVAEIRMSQQGLAAIPVNELLKHHQRILEQRLESGQRFIVSYCIYGLSTYFQCS